MSDERMLASLRGMAWERAKGELNSIGQASYTSGDSKPGVPSKGDIWMAKVKSFIREIEDNGLLP